MLPAFVVHADWGTKPKKRVLAVARRLPDGGYRIEAPGAVGRGGSWRDRLDVPSEESGTVLVGFDFPIGVPSAYAQRARVQSFREALTEFGHGRWSEFYDVCTSPVEIGIHRPFFPNSCPVRGMCRHEHLTTALCLSWDELYRQCERKTADRGAACPLFWTLGGNQVGKAAIAGWRECVGPMLAEGAHVGLWPFDGAVRDLLGSRSVVIVETYPTEFYRQLGFQFGRGKHEGKRSQAARQRVAKHLLMATRDLDCEFSEAAQDAITSGFGPRPDGEDPFDALVGVLGILKHLRAATPTEPPADATARSVEGWIFGQSAGDD